MLRCETLPFGFSFVLRLAIASQIVTAIGLRLLLLLPPLENR